MVADYLGWGLGSYPSIHALVAECRKAVVWNHSDMVPYHSSGPF